MKNKIKCYFGFHKWFKYIPSEKVCKCCKKKQKFVVYPFRSSLKYWETFKDELGIVNKNIKNVLFK